MNQTFLGGFLIFIGVLGFFVGLITGHLLESTTQTLLYILPIILGVIMIVLDNNGKRKP